MEVVEDLSRCPHPASGTVVTIGAYDGVHRGHRRLIALVRELAAARGAASAVVTFDRHPALVVRPDTAPRLLTDTDTKLELLAGTGLDYAVVVPFDEARSREPAEDFVREVLVGCLAARLVVVGHDFHFGYRRGGNVELLARIGPGLGFEALGVELFAEGADAVAVSSTRIRSLLGRGDVAGAAFLLGRPHRLRGTATADAAGTTELVVPAEYLRPAAGQYAGWLVVEAEPGSGGRSVPGPDGGAFTGADGSERAAFGDVAPGRPPGGAAVLVSVDAAGQVRLAGLVGPGPLPAGRTAHVEFVDRLADPPDGAGGSPDGRSALRARQALGLS